MPVSDLPWVSAGSNMEISATFSFWMPRILKHNSKTYKKWSVLQWFVHLFPRAMAKAEKKMKTYPGFLLKGFIYLSMLHRFTHVVLTCQRIKIFGSDMISVRFTEVLHQLQWRHLRRRIKIQLSYCTKRLSNHKKVAINIFYRLVWVPQVDRQSLVSIYFKIVSMKNYLLESDSQLINPKTEINVEDMKLLAT